MQTQSLKQTIYQDEDCHFEVEDLGKWAFLHVTVQGWSASKFKKMIAVFGQFLNEASGKGYEKMVTISPNPKFCKMFGGKFESAFTQNGTTYEVYAWELKPVSC